MKLRFGTDGIRGVANTEITPELVVALGRAAARILGGDRFLVGRDTRVSGPMLQAALASGLAAEGADVVDLGVLPTPGIAWFSAAETRPAAVISASHNPFQDNGIKFFAPGGRKIDDGDQAALEAQLDTVIGTVTPPGLGLTGAALGHITLHQGPEPYVDALVGHLRGRRLDGLRVVLDCANGAATWVGPEVFRRLGAEVRVINDQPDGVNINDGCGSTHMKGLQDAVVAIAADVGLAFDGDADRVLAVDGRGEVVDGDQLIAICAFDRQARGLLAGDTVVVTVMANLGLRQALDRARIKVVETKVGDRHVLEKLEQGGWALGGEQSGHIIFRDLATTGDGILTAIQVMDAMARSGRSLADLAAVMTRLPQVLKNVRVADRRLEGATELWEEVRKVEDRLGSDGRVLVRASGTEAVIRIMVEAPTSEEAVRACDELGDVALRVLGLPTA